MAIPSIYKGITNFTLKKGMKVTDFNRVLITFPLDYCVGYTVPIIKRRQR